MICKKCGNEVSIMDKTCASCGADLTMPNAVGYKHLDKLTNMNVDNIIKAVEDKTDGTMREIDDAMDNTKDVTQETTNSTPSHSAPVPKDVNRVSNRGLNRKDFEIPRTGTRSLKEIDVKQIKVELDDSDYMNQINYSFTNNNIPEIWKLSITNISQKKAGNVIVKCSIVDYSSEFKTTILNINPNEACVMRNIRIPLSREKISKVKEKEKSFLNLEISIAGEEVFAQSYPVEILAFNEWYYVYSDHRNYNRVYAYMLTSPLLASFVFPNSEAISNEILNGATEYLGTENNGFCGYQAGEKYVNTMVRSIYLYLQSKLNYRDPPASFEAGQKVLLPDAILEQYAGTCLDLALLFAGCLERAGLYPLIFVISGHAYLGYWTNKESWQDFWETDDDLGSDLPIEEDKERSMPAEDPDDYVKRITNKLSLRHERIKLAIFQEETIVPLNSTTFTDKNKTFDECIEVGRYYAQKQQFEVVIDVKRARMKNITPLPL